MPCHSATTKAMITVREDQTVGDVLSIMKKKDIDAVPVVDKDKKLVGLFSIHILLKNLLPVSVSMADGMRVDIAIQAAPGVAKRLRKVEPLEVSQLMERKYNSVNPETPTWEGISMLVERGSPVLVIERESEKLLGMMTLHSALEELQRLKDSDS